MKKSRRAFLADLLFLGGGLTAAAFLAKGPGASRCAEAAPVQWPEQRQFPGDGSLVPLIHELDDYSEIEDDCGTLYHRYRKEPKSGCSCESCAPGTYRDIQGLSPGPR